MTNAKEVFTYLDKYMALPKYQLERRADIFFALYLEKVLSTILKDECKIVLPEFPLRCLKSKEKKSWKEITKIDELIPIAGDSSTNIDYLIAGKKCLYFIELKTEKNSFDPKQYWSYQFYSDRKNASWRSLMSFLLKLSEASKKSDKYKEAIKQIQNADLQIINETKENSADINDVRVIYIAPEGILEKSKGRLKRFKDSEEREGNLITLDQFAKTIKELGNNDDFSKRFVESLEKWNNN